MTKVTREQIQLDWKVIQVQMLEFMQEWNPSNLPAGTEEAIDPFLRDMEGGAQEKFEIGELVSLLCVMVSQGIYSNNEE